MHHDELNSRWAQLKSSWAQLKMSSIVSLKKRTDLLFCEMNQVLLKFWKFVCWQDTIKAELQDKLSSRKKKTQAELQVKKSNTQSC